MQATLIIKLPEGLEPPEHVKPDALITVNLTDADVALLVLRILEAAEQIGALEVHAVD
jgi:hypothetical protein